MTDFVTDFLSPPPNKAPHRVGSLRSYSPVLFCLIVGGGTVVVEEEIEEG